MNPKIADEIHESLRDQIENLRAVRGSAIANATLATFHFSQINHLVTMVVRHLGQHCEDFDAPKMEKMLSHRIGSLNIDVMQWLGITKQEDFDEVSKTAERMALQCIVTERPK